MYRRKMEGSLMSNTAAILITGGTGFVGARLVAALKKRFPLSPLYLCVRPGSESKVREVGALPLVYDGTSKSLSSWSLSTTQEVHVFHLATCFRSQHAFTDLDEMISANLGLGIYLLDWLRNFDSALFLNVGSFAQYNSGVSVSQNLYVATKNAFETFVDFYSQSNLKCKNATVYLSDTYGPNDPRPKVLNLLINASREKRELKLSPGRQELSLLHVDDACAGIIAAYLARLNGDEIGPLRYSLASNEIKPLIEIASLVEGATGNYGYYKFGSLPYRNKEVMKFVPAFSPPPKWQPSRSLADGIAELL